MKNIIPSWCRTNWERKTISLIAALFIWIFVNHSLTLTKTFDNIPVRIVNVIKGATVEGIQSNGILEKKIALALTGKKSFLNEIKGEDLEVVIDAKDKTEKWISTITKKNLLSTNPDINISKAHVRVSPLSLPISLTKLMSDKIPVIITYPIGECPSDYQFIDVYPYQLYQTVSGPESVLKQIKSKGLSLTFNLHNISHADLEACQKKESPSEVSFTVPQEWKKLHIPLLSENLVDMNDPDAANLALEFIRNDTHLLLKPLPVTLFFPPEHRLKINPETFKLAENSLIYNVHGISLIQKMLYAKGVSRLFIDVVQDMMEIVVIMSLQKEHADIEWSLQFINPKILEDRYVSLLMSDSPDETQDAFHIKKKEEHLRYRFRSYMNRLQLYSSSENKLNLKIHLDGRTVIIEEKN